MVRYQRIIDAVLEKPWAILPSKLTQISHLLIARQNGVQMTADQIQEIIEAEPYHQHYLAARQGRRGPDRQQPKVAVVPLYGVLTPRADLLSNMSGGTGLDSFMEAMVQAAEDPGIDEIIIDVDSPGGQTDMVPEAAALIREIRQTTPVTAVANTMAASAAYWLAAQATELVVSPSAQVGSIGVYAAHQDISRAQEVLGVKTTLVSAGKYKTELSELEPLTAEARGYVQEQVDHMYAMFVQDVARGRNTPLQKVRDGYGQGRMLHAQQAVGEGMADRVGTFNQVVQRALSRRTTVAELASPRPTAGSLAPPLAEASRFYAGPIPYQKTGVVDEPWDGPGEEAKMSNDAGASTYRKMYAWVDSKGDPDTKAAYKFPHHKVTNGQPGPAVANGVRNALARLPQANIPPGDRSGVEAHLQHHLRDFKGSSDDESTETTPDNEQKESLLSDQWISAASASATEGFNDFWVTPSENPVILVGDALDARLATPEMVGEATADSADQLEALRRETRQKATKEREEYLALLRRLSR